MNKRAKQRPQNASGKARMSRQDLFEYGAQILGQHYKEKSKSDFQRFMKTALTSRLPF
jgi:hypothetical protein